MQETGNVLSARQLILDGVNLRNFQTLSTLCRPDVVYRSPSAVTIGVSKFVDEIHRLLKAFPDLHYSLEYAMSDDSRTIVRTICRSTHRHDWQGMRASYRRLSIPMVWIFSFQDDRIADIEVLFDVQNVVSQLSFGAAVGLR